MGFLPARALPSLSGNSEDLTVRALCGGLRALLFPYRALSRFADGLGSFDAALVQGAEVITPNPKLVTGDTQ